MTTFWQRDRPGVVMTADSKRSYHNLMVGCLFNHKIMFERDLFTQSRKMTPERILALSQEQFERFHWDVVPPKDNHGKPRTTITGKLGSKQDDSLISTLMTYKYGMDLQFNPMASCFSHLPREQTHRTAYIRVCS